MKLRKPILLLLSALLLIGLCVTAFAAGKPGTQFSLYADVAEDSWYAPYVRLAENHDLMNGVSETEFKPEGTLTRAMFVTMLYRAAGEPEVPEYLPWTGSNDPATGESIPAKPFADVPAGSWYDNAVHWAVEKKITNGVSAAGNTFAPNAPITRAQLVTMLWRYAGAQSMGSAKSPFIDVLNFEYYWDAVDWSYNNQIVTGITPTTFAPDKTATRAQAAAILCRYLKLDQTLVTREQMEDAVTALGWAYYAKEKKIQYDSVELTTPILSKYFGGSYRVTENVAPEYGTSDTTIFSVCTDYTTKCYYNALDFALMDHPLNFVTRSANNRADSFYKEDLVVLRWWGDNYNGDGKLSEEMVKYGATEDKRMTSDEVRAFLKDWDKNLRPGDIFIHSGHALIYMGNGQITHCWGGKYSRDTGTDSYELSGSIATGTVESVFLEGPDLVTKNSYLIKDQDKTSTGNYLLIVRPINVLMDGDHAKLGVTIPKDTQTRLQYPVMEIDRTVSITPLGTAYTGQELTYSMVIRNATTLKEYRTYRTARDGKAYEGEDYKGLPVTDKVPAGTTLVPGSITEGGIYDEKTNTVTWNVDISAGTSKNLAYKVTVNAKRGETIAAADAWVGNIHAAEITNKVGGTKLDDAAKNYLKLFYQDRAENWEKDYGIVMEGKEDHEFAEQVYDKVLGVKLDLPSPQELLDNVYEIAHIKEKEGLGYHKFESKEAWIYTLRQTVDEKWQNARDMMIPTYTGGAGVYFPNDLERINEFDCKYLEPGDVIYMCNLSDYKENDKPRTVSNTQCVVYLGDKCFAFWDGESRAISRIRGESKVWAAFMYDFFVALRPTKAADSMPTGTPAFIPEKRSEVAVETLKERQDAIVAEGWAFYDKAQRFQAGGNNYTSIATKEFGDGRNTMYLAPEQLNEDTNWYGTVGAFLMSIIKEALGEKPVTNSFMATYNRFGGLLSNFEPDVTVYSYGQSELISVVSAEEFKAMLQPGDIFVITQSSSDYEHNLYLGGDDSITLLGAKADRYDFKAGTVKLVPEGMIQLEKISDIVTDEKLQSALVVIIARFANMTEYNEKIVTDAAKGHIAYPHMVIDRTASLSPYETAALGSDVTYTVTVTNKSGAAYENLAITETVPAMTTLKTAEGAQNDNGKLTWTVNVPAGQSVTVRYTVTVSADAADLGKKLTCDGGTAGGVPTGALANTIGGAKLTAEQQATLAALPTEGWQNGGMQFAIDVYNKLGVDLSGSLGGKTILSLFGSEEDGTITGKTGFFAKRSSKTVKPAPAPSAGYEDAYAMLVDGFVGGYNVQIGNSLARIREFRRNYFEPGDILVKTEKVNDTLSYVVDIYVGNDKFLQAKSEVGSKAAPTVTVETYDDTTGVAWGTLKYENLYFCLLRPTQLSADINKK